MRSHPSSNWSLDVMAAGVAAASLADYLPALAALLSIVWTAIRIWETRTVQRWVRRRP